ncbi:MAG TPA: CbtB domain-containing protein [Streptosporangiaceae bacterium]|jgi:cobalt transporter subunit CbtB|nr:CbtB domain-containing protein [Streptosporangiaceae bacterium]
MSSPALPTTHARPAEAEPVLRLRTITLTAFVVALALLTLYAVFFGQYTFLHELAHDGRHLFGAPCH